MTMDAFEGKGLLLLSGGFDSPVAGHLLHRKGLDLVALHISYEPVTDDASVAKAVRLAAHVGIPTLLVVRAGDAFKEVVKHCVHKLYFVITKRLMMRVASEVARREGCDYLITGESLGQVSSQTLRNLDVIDAAATVPVLRPLVGFDKREIIDRARAIGTYEISVGPELCDILGPKHPATHARLEDVEREEAKVDVARLLAGMIETLRVVDVAAEPLEVAR
jgi:thiamine biosynthesis protein ThiI